MDIPFRADLHCHSTCSDGTVSPTGLVDLALKSGLKGLSITDHDTIAAYQEALPYAQKMGVKLLSGVEFSTVLQDTNIHILAYGFSLKNSLIESFCAAHQLRRTERNRMMLNKLGEKGLKIQEEDFDLDNHSQSIGRPHIAQAMVKKGYVNSLQQAFKLYIGEGCPCYAAGKKFSTQETLELIHEAKGLAIIAHPHLIKDPHAMKKLLDMKFDGIEAYYARFPQNRHTRWLEIGKRKNWLITGGSDFHGLIKPDLALGSSYVDEERFNKLYTYFEASNKN